MASSRTCVGILVAASLLFAAIAPAAAADWGSLATTNAGPATVYGAPGPTSNGKGACSFGTNQADTTGLPWSTAPAGASDGGIGYPTTFVALNDDQWSNGAFCGSCIWFRGTGDGVGVESRKVSDRWQYGFIDNRCPECKKGAIDLARGYDVGDGIWDVEWYAVPCQVGGKNLHYDFVASNGFFFNLVVSNTLVPVAAVSAVINGQTIDLKRTSNNNWAYHTSAGPYSFPIDIEITPICGDSVKDTIVSAKGVYGKVQFSPSGCKDMGNPTTGGGSSAPDSGSVQTESKSSRRAVVPKPSKAPTPKKTPKPTADPDALRKLVTKPPTAAPTAKPTKAPTAPRTEAPMAAPTGRPTKAPTARRTKALTASPTAKPTKAPTAMPTKAPTQRRTRMPTAAPTAKPTKKPTARRTRKPSPKKTPKPLPRGNRRNSATKKATKKATQKATKKATQKATKKATASSRIAKAKLKAATASRTLAPSKEELEKKEQDTEDFIRELFGGKLAANGQAVLPKWYQCGDTRGRYPNVACGTPGFNCVYVNYFYWQCRDDAGGPSVQGRKLMAPGRKL